VIMAGGKAEITGAHLVGAINLASVAEVFEKVPKILGTHIKRLPDGEPGGRRLWVSYQYPLLRAKTFLEPETEQGGRRTFLPALRAKDDDPAAMDFGELGYAREARASFIEFTEAVAAGVIEEDCKFQVCLPTPLAVTYSFIARDSLASVEQAYERAMIAEVARIAAFIPHDKLAVQWDVCHEMLMWDGRIFGRPENPWNRPFENVKEQISARLLRLAEAVPADIELGFHLCYGDLDHKHFMEPTDAAAMVGLANMLSAKVRRPIHWLHMPVPRERTDADYFKPLAELTLDSETELYLGLVHHTDGAAGTRARIEAAQKYVARFGVATECGMGRRPADTIEALLQIHADVSAEPL